MSSAIRCPRAQTAVPALPASRGAPRPGKLYGTFALVLVCCCGFLLAGCERRELAPAGDPGSTAEREVAAVSFERVAPYKPLDLTRPLRAGFLIVDGVYNSELMAPYDVFHHTPFHTEPHPGIEVFTVSPDGAPVTSFEGLEIAAHHSFADAPAIDILVVPSAEGSMTTDLENEELIGWVRKVGQEAGFLVSLCDGAFVLAAAGLLDGRAVTTFPGDQDRFAERFPHLDLRRGISFVHDGAAITSAGGAKSYEPAMYLVDHLYGERATQGVGGGLLIDWPPDPERVPHILVPASAR